MLRVRFERGRWGVAIYFYALKLTYCYASRLVNTRMLLVKMVTNSSLHFCASING